MFISMFNFIESSRHRDLRIVFCSYGMPNASSSAMTMEAAMVKGFGKIPDDAMLRSTTPGPSTHHKRQHSQPNILTPSPKKRPPPKRQPVDGAKKSSDIVDADISEV
jgi:hypothetical protein